MESRRHRHYGRVAGGERRRLRALRGPGPGRRRRLDIALRSEGGVVQGPGRESVVVDPGVGWRFDFKGLKHRSQTPPEAYNATGGLIPRLIPIIGTLLLAHAQLI